MKSQYRTVVRNLHELRDAMSNHARLSDQQSTSPSKRHWSHAPIEKDNDDTRDHGQGEDKKPPQPSEQQPDDHVIERTLPSRRPIGPTDV